MSIFEQNYAGRGIRFIFTFAPPMSENELLFFKATINNSILPKYFKTIDITRYSDTAAKSQIKVFCPEVKFSTSLSEAEKKYTEIFENVYSLVTGVCFKLNKQFDTTEYSFLYRYTPKEKPNEFVPIFPLKKVGALLFWRRVYAKSMEEDVTSKIKKKGDKAKFKEVFRECTDERPLAYENADYILRVAEDIGLFKPYKTVDEVKHIHTIPLDVAMKMPMKGGVGYGHYMPLTEKEANLVKEYIATL